MQSSYTSQLTMEVLYGPYQNHLDGYSRKAVTRMLSHPFAPFEKHLYRQLQSSSTPTLRSKPRSNYSDAKLAIVISRSRTTRTPKATMSLSKKSFAGEKVLTSNTTRTLKATSQHQLQTHEPPHNLPLSHPKGRRPTTNIKQSTPVCPYPNDSNVSGTPSPTNKPTSTWKSTNAAQKPVFM
jgi:hypothetical protein